MRDLICPFSATLVKDVLGCRRARKIVRRGGGEIACDAESAHSNCTRLFQAFKDVALPVFELEDDLLQVPHGVLVKIQFGGLLGLQRITNGNKTTEPSIPDIATLVDAAITQFSSLEAIPCTTLCDDITTYKLSRRRR